tara:strand:+ start:793 stop:969 length:177 start_codon:yes stop_codon:yes gene_type:complete
MFSSVKKIKDPTTDKVCSYKVTTHNSNTILYVPLSPDNTDYQAIQEWVAEGNKIEEAD